MDTTGFPPLHELLPHRGRALLLDRVVSWSPQGARCQTILTRNFPYLRDGRAPALCGIELLAQTASVFSALARRVGTNACSSSPDRSPLVGYLVGIPEAAFYAEELPLGVTLTTSVEASWQEGPGSRFRGELTSKNQTLLSAELSVWEPEVR